MARAAPAAIVEYEGSLPTCEPQKTQIRFIGERAWSRRRAEPADDCLELEFRRARPPGRLGGRARQALDVWLRYGHVRADRERCVWGDAQRGRSGIALSVSLVAV